MSQKLQVKIPVDLSSVEDEDEDEQLEDTGQEMEDAGLRALDHQIQTMKNRVQHFSNDIGELASKVDGANVEAWGNFIKLAKSVMARALKSPVGK